MQGVININAPYYYDYVNAQTSIVTPSTVHVTNTTLSQFFQRLLMERASSVYKWDVPEHWDIDYFRAVLYYWGFVCIIKTDKFGVIPQNAGLGGFNVFYRPKFAIVNNPLIRYNGELTIGEKCEIIKLRSDYRGFQDIITYYANQLALVAETFSVNVLNSKLSYIFAAKNKAAAESLKKMYDQIASGNPATIIDKDLFMTDGTPLWQFISQNVGQNYIGDKLIDDFNTLIDRYDTEVGIPNANTDKKARLNVDEVHSNDVATYSAAAERLERLQNDCKRVRDMFGIEISVDWRFKPDSNTGGVDDGSRDYNDVGSIQE